MVALYSRHTIYKLYTPTVHTNCTVHQEQQERKTKKSKTNNYTKYMKKLSETNGILLNSFYFIVLVYLKRRIEEN